MRGETSEKNGLAVVAPMRATTPASTSGSMTSCCVRLKRCSSSTNNMVRRPPAARRSRASSSAARSSLTPHEAALSGTNSRSCLPGDHLGQRGFSRAGRPVKDGGDEAVGVEHPPQQLAGAEKVFLAGKFVDRAGPHPRRQGHGPLQILGFLAVKQTHGRVQSRSCKVEGPPGGRLSQFYDLQPGTLDLARDKKIDLRRNAVRGKHVMNP